MAANIILVTGGARSGKSAFAEQLTAKGKKVAYLATAQIFDEEMRFRVQRHQKRRPADWQTYEAPTQAEQAIREAAKGHDTILFDCITLYLSNYLCSFASLPQEEVLYQGSKELITKLLAAAKEAKANGTTTIFVTNEVGAGIVPENQLARFYRDLSGLANQQIAAAADSVYFVVSGIPVDIKKLKAGV